MEIKGKGVANSFSSNRDVRSPGPLGSYSMSQASSGDAASNNTATSRETPIRRLVSHDTTSVWTVGMPKFTMPPRELISECIALYFQYCHKQPLWLFDPESFSNSTGRPEEIILGISSLALRYSQNHIRDGQADQLSRQYAKAAHSLISLRIAQGSVTLSTMQALCLIALSEYICLSLIINRRRALR